MGLSREQCDKLRAAYFYDGIQAMPSKHDPQRFAVTIPLTEALSLEGARALVSQEMLEDDSYGVFVSLVTDRETGGVVVPKFVREVSRALAGSLEFSFTVIHPEEVDPPLKA